MRRGLCVLLLLWSAGAFEAAVAAVAVPPAPHAPPAPHVTCKDENNTAVDWYILYKTPGGQNHVYISADGRQNTIKKIADANGVLANTLRPMFDNNMPNSFGFLSYSDQPPTKHVGDSFGHSKGVVLGDSATRTALWLTHSTPQFPKTKNPKTFWPTSGNLNGQTFMCVTFEFQQLKAVGTHLQHIHAFTFDKNIPDSFPQEIRDAGHNRTPLLIQSLKVGNKQLTLLAKATGQTAADGDLYVQLTRQFNSEMDAKPWGCQLGKDRSYCEPNLHKVMNVIEVEIDKEQWPWSKDHSKWAVTTDGNIHWTCIGDMNRAPSQYERPGGALCIDDQRTNHLFRGFVKERLPCGQDPKKRPGDCPTTVELDLLSDDLEELDLNADLDSVSDNLQKLDLNDDLISLADAFQEVDLKAKVDRLSDDLLNLDSDHDYTNSTITATEISSHK